MAQQAKPHGSLSSPAMFPAARAVATALAALVFILAPAIAQAAFKATTVSTASIGTYTIPAPATATWTFSCVNTTNNHRYTLHLTDFGSVNRADSYLVTITAPDLTTDSQTTTIKVLTMTKTSATAGIFTFTIRARVGTWTGPPFSHSDTC